MVVIIIGSAKRSIKNAPTKGTIKKAFGEGPNFFVTASILAIAFGVAPRPWRAFPKFRVSTSTI